MEETLVKSSDIFLKKTKFFANRLVVYFSFLLIPVLIQKGLELNLFIQTLLMMLYMVFMSSQWFLLGKEIDHRLKIYFRANSTMDRVLYRLVVGSAFTMILFNLMTFLPESWIKHFFWGFWVCLGLFYSWPTRGKIIQESVSTQFTEYRYLDSFEKTVLFLTLLMLLASIPFYPYFDNLDSLKILIDPDEKISQQYWNYLSINYFPFKKFPHLIYLAWCLHFYFVGMMFFIGSLYGILRFFYSRRLSILGIFAAISTWSFSLILQKDPFSIVLTSFSALWIWGILWSVKSSTYRAGLMFGLLCYLGVSLNYQFFWLFPIGLGLLYALFLDDKTLWYRRQFLKYSMLGLVLSILVILFQVDIHVFGDGMELRSVTSQLSNLIKRKAFFALAVIGIIEILLLRIPWLKKRLPPFTLDDDRLKQLLLSLSLVLLVGILFEKNLLRGMGLIWVLTFFSMIPLEWIFQIISRFRSKRNFIYMAYVLICLLDSHFEGRVRITAKFFKNSQPYSKQIQ